DGVSSESDVLGEFYGDNVPPSVHTTTNAAHLLFTSDGNRNGTGFELHWEHRVRGVVSPQLVTGNVGDLQELECRVTASQAAANITWILNGRDITSEAHAEIIPNDLNCSFVTLSTLQHALSPEDNGQELSCVVSHPTLADPEITTVLISMYTMLHISLPT
ncbi:unnamed protein product, partial [Meganyctiphanes norvegica]